MKVLAIDRGSKMIGLAKSSVADNVIFPVGYLKNDGDVYFNLAGIIAQEQATQLVVGLPRKEILIQEKIKKFVGKLQLFVDIPVAYVGEDYTSVEAGDILSQIQPGKDAYTKTPAKDAVAAMKILERWIKDAV